MIAFCHDIAMRKRGFATMKINFGKIVPLTHLAEMQKEPGVSEYQRSHRPIKPDKTFATETPSIMRDNTVTNHR